MRYTKLENGNDFFTTITREWTKTFFLIGFNTRSYIGVNFYWYRFDTIKCIKNYYEE